MATDTKSILVLARRDHTEAMRVAAGLTIFGHAVRLVFMSEPLAETQANAEMAELLELSDITPETTVPERAGELKSLNSKDLGAAIAASDRVVNL
ncbi:MAG: hypothetical protein P8Z80_15495 [Pseudolabrys sp.]